MELFSPHIAKHAMRQEIKSPRGVRVAQLLCCALVVRVLGYYYQFLDPFWTLVEELTLRWFLIDDIVVMAEDARLAGMAFLQGVFGLTAVGASSELHAAGFDAVRMISVEPCTMWSVANSLRFSKAIGGH